MKKSIYIMHGILFYCLVPLIGVAYFAESIWYKTKKTFTRKEESRTGRVTKWNPVTDKW